MPLKVIVYSMTGIVSQIAYSLVSADTVMLVPVPPFASKLTV